MHVVVVPSDRVDDAFAFVPDAAAEAVTASGHDVVALQRGAPFQVAFDALARADAAVVDASAPNLTAGWVTAWSLAKARLVVVCAPAAGPTLPPLVAGNPAPWQRVVTFDDAATLQARLSALLR